MKNILKLLLSIPTFIILIYIYYMLVSLILMIPIYIFLGENQEFMSSGIWAYFLIIGMVFGAILSFFSTKKILFRKNNIVVEDENTDKLLEEYNNQ